MITRAALAACIDHTLLAPEATADDVVALCAEAVELGGRRGVRVAVPGRGRRRPTSPPTSRSAR